MAHPGGRPREYDRIAVGIEFVQWVKDHPECLTVPHFTTSNGYSTPRLLEWVKEDQQFREYYMEAKELIGINRLKATMANKDNGEKVLDKTIYLRHVHNFDSDIKACDREDKAFEASLKNESSSESKAVNVNIIDYSGQKKLDVT